MMLRSPVRIDWYAMDYACKNGMGSTLDLTVKQLEIKGVGVLDVFTAFSISPDSKEIHFVRVKVIDDLGTHTPDTRRLYVQFLDNPRCIPAGTEGLFQPAVSDPKASLEHLVPTPKYQPGLSERAGHRIGRAVMAIGRAIRYVGHRVDDEGLGWCAVEIVAFATALAIISARARGNTDSDRD